MEEITDIKIENELMYVKVLNENGSVKEIREVAPDYNLEENEEEATGAEWVKDQKEKFSHKIIAAFEDEEIKKRKKKLASILINNYTANVELFYKDHPFFYDGVGIFWFWKDNKYEQVDDIDVMNMLDDSMGFMGQTVNSQLKSHYLEAFRRVGRKKTPKDAPKKWVQFNGKAISLESGNIYDVTPDYFFTNPIPWNIGEDESTPTIDNLIKDWVGEKYRQTAYEIISYCCYTDYPIHMIICLIGCGRNGKSKFLGLINKFIGRDNICSTELDVLLDSRFESFKLYKKLACTMGETNWGVISKTSLLKKLTGQDLIGFEYKHKKPFDDYNYAKILIGSNSLPPSEDTSEGFYRRWLILDFPNIFKEGRDILKDIPDNEYNNLAKKVTRILPQLIKNSEFTNQGSIEERAKRYILASNPLSFFINLFFKKDFNCYLRYSELYMAYRRFLHLIKHRKISVKEFNDVLALEGLEIVRTTKRINGEYVNGKFVEGIDFVLNMSHMQVSTISSLYSIKDTKTCITYINFIKNLIKNKQGANPMTEIEEIEEKDIIHQPCNICGANPSHIFNKKGNPLCELCYKAQSVQKHP